MYGSGAIGGAINIYTKDGEDKNLNKLLFQVDLTMQKT